MICRFTAARNATVIFLVAPLSIAYSQPTPSVAPSVASSASAPSLQSLPFVSPIFGDNMVLQRGKPDTLWGWSEPGDRVRVEIGDARASGVAGPDRRWQVAIQPPPAGGPYTVKIAGRQTVELQNVMVGDVWLCGGQSNMGLPLQFTLNGADEVKAANYPDIRFLALVQICARGRNKASGGVKTTRRVLHSRLQGQFGS